MRNQPDRFRDLNEPAPMPLPTAPNILGSSIRSVDFRDLRASETRYAACAHLPPHEHEFGYVSLVLRGGFEETAGRGSQSASSASVVVMPPGIAHSEQMSPDGARSFTIVLKPSLLANHAESSRHLRSCRWFHGGPAAKLMLCAYQDFLLADARTDLALAEHVFGLSYLIGGQPHPAKNPPLRSVSAAADLLNAQASTEMSFGDLAAAVGVDPAYLARAFHRKMGCTMSQYRRRLWVRRAAHLLSSTHEPLAQIAFRAGFADQSHLTRTFRSETGLTPQAYRTLTSRK